MSLNNTACTNIMLIVQHLNWASCWIWNDNDLLKGYLIGCNFTQTEFIWTSINLLDELKGQERKHECLVFKDNNKHVFTQFYGLNDTIKCNFRPIFALMVIPDNHLVSGRWKHQYYEIGLVQHLNYLHRLVQILKLFSDLISARVILDNLKASLRCYSKIVHRLIAWNHFYIWCILWNIILDKLAPRLISNFPFFCLNNLSWASQLVDWLIALIISLRYLNTWHSIFFDLLLLFLYKMTTQLTPRLKLLRGRFRNTFDHVLYLIL